MLGNGDLSNSGSRSSADGEEVPLMASPIVEHRQLEISNVQSNLYSTTALSLPAVEQVHILERDSPKTKSIMQTFEAIAHLECMLGSPRTDMLLHLIQFNFIKALIQNMEGSLRHHLRA
ncbi:hypothetical protein BDV12DRAFT_164007 [Aspergillus spectabilis]